MLGCQDFCGYYDWTFHHVRRRWGNDALRDLWAGAIAEDSQSHYLRAAQADGLRGLMQTWDRTGADERCDWTFTLDEEKSVLRWDMRRCPSKGYLLANNLNAGEDYCDHCMGWIVPLLAKAGIQVAAHEHNHCGQCWAEMRVNGKPYQTLADQAPDIRRDPRWLAGYLDRWTDGIKESTDPCDVLEGWFDRAGESIIVVASDAYIAADNEPAAVVVENYPTPEHLDAIACRIAASAPDQRPLLLYGYLPNGGDAAPPFEHHNLPRPVPILPLLIRRGSYHHRPDQPPPTTEEFARLVVIALGT